MKNKDFKQFEKAYVYLKAFQGFTLGWSNATYAFFILSRGYELYHLAFVNAFFMLFATLLDPYTGKLADKFGQKKIYTLSILFWAIGTFVYFRSTSIPGFLVAELLAALGFALSSDALESWIHNNVDVNGTHSAPIRARGGWWYRMAGIPSAILGGVIGSYAGFEVPWLIESVTAVVMLIFAIKVLGSLPEGKHQHEEQEDVSVIASLKESRNSKILMYSLLFSLITSFAFQSLNMFWTEIMRNASDGADYWQGFVWIPVAIALAYGSRITKGVENVSKKQILAVLIILSAFIGIAGFAANAGILLILLVSYVGHEVPRGAIDPLMFTYANEHIRSVNRSTMNSIRSAFRPLGSMLGLVFFGSVLYLNLMSPEQTWLVSSIMILLFACYSWLRLKD